MKKFLFSLGFDDTVPIPVFVCGVSQPLLPAPMHIFEPRYKLMIRRCLASGKSPETDEEVQ